MPKFIMDATASKEAARKATSKGGFSNFKIEKVVSKLLILPPVIEGHGAIFTARHHEIWANQKPISKYGAPSTDGEKDRVSDIGWKLRDKYKESSTEKKKEFFKKFLPKTNYIVNVLDLDNISNGPQIYQMSGAVAETVLDEFNDLDGDLSSICSLDEGRVLIVKHNGKKGLGRRYKAKFLEPANLIGKGLLDDDAVEEISGKIADLTKMQQKYSKEAEEKHLSLLAKLASKIGIDLDDLGVDEEDNNEDEFEKNDSFDEDGFGDDSTKDDSVDDSDLDFSDDDFEEEKKGSKSRRG